MPVCPSGHVSATDDYCDVCGDLMENAPPADFTMVERGGGPIPESLRRRPEPAAPPPPEPEPEPESCPDCGTPRSGRFCENCGYDFALPAPASAPASDAASDAASAGDAEADPDPDPDSGAEARSEPARADEASGGGDEAERPQAGWCAVIVADRGYFDSVIAQEGPDSGELEFPPYCPERRVPLAGGQVRIGRRSASRGISPEIDLTGPPQDPGVSHLHAVLLARPEGGWLLVDPGSTNGTTVNGGAEPIAVNVPVPVGDGDRVHVGAWTTITLSQQEATP